MTGVQFSYEVVRIDRRQHADLETFRESQGDLVLFVKDEQSRDYILVSSILSPGVSG